MFEEENANLMLSQGENKHPSEFIREIRLDYAAKLLRTTQITVSEVMFRAGFSNKSYFYREFQKQYNDSPKDYRNKAGVERSTS